MSSNIFDQVDAIIDYSKIKVVIFDVDGTLYDQRKLRFYMVKHIFIYLLKNPLKIREISILNEFRKQRELHSNVEIENLNLEQYSWAAIRCGVSSSTVEKIVKKWIFEIPLMYVNKCRKNGIKRLFEKIRQNNIKISIYSDYPAGSKMKELELVPDLVVSSTDAEISSLKPAPKALEYIAKYFNFQPSECIMIGDREEKDGKCAINAGMPYFIT